MPDLPAEIPLAQFIVERFKQVGVQNVYGVPGDFNLEFLDFIEDDPKLQWVGNANELNSAYAADGHSRVTHSLQVVVTTFGVGELSALNGIAGSMSERLPIVHLVGVPSTSLQAKGALLHHTLGDGKFTNFSDMSAHISAGTCLLRNGSRFIEEVDQVLTTCLTQCRPVYMTLPTNLVHHLVSSEALNTPLPSPHSGPVTLTDGKPSESLQHVVDIITERFVASKRPVVIVDACCARFGCVDLLKELVEGTGVRFFETTMAKATLDEEHPQYGGVYVGANSLPAIRKEVEDADFVLFVGRLESDFNSGSFTFDVPVKSTVELHSFATKVGFATYPDADVRTILPFLNKSLISAVKSSGKKTLDKPLIKEGEEQRAAAADVPSEPGNGLGDVISQKWFWPRMGKFFKNGDVVLAETGTSAFGIVNVPFPTGASLLNQTLWGSIGWATGATLGAALGARELGDSRVVLFTGDGSLQLTVQEIGTMIRRKVCPYLFVLNNDGYEIERQIHGVTAEYNNIQMYDHQLLLPFFAGKSTHPYQSYAIHTPAELNKLLDDPEFNKPDKIRLIEVFLPRGDAPESLINQGKLTAEANAAP